MMVLDGACTANCTNRFGKVQYRWRLFELPDDGPAKEINDLANKTLGGISYIYTISTDFVEMFPYLHQCLTQ